MVQLGNLKFSSSFGVLYKIKSAKGHKTINETYNSLETDNIDDILEVLRLAYNEENKCDLSLDDFVKVLDENEFGFFKITDCFTQLVEAFMFNGLSEKEASERKNALMNLMKK